MENHTCIIAVMGYNIFTTDHANLCCYIRHGSRCSCGCINRSKPSRLNNAAKRSICTNHKCTFNHKFRITTHGDATYRGSL